jgi:hypothetical protein
MNRLQSHHTLTEYRKHGTQIRPSLLIFSSDCPHTLDDYLSRLPEKEQQAIDVRTEQLIEQEASLRQLRAARQSAQEEIARRLGSIKPQFRSSNAVPRCT